MHTAVAVFCIIVGVAICAMWTADLRRGAWERPDRSHAELGLHLAAEFLAAAWLIGAAVALLTVGAAAIPWLAVGLGLLLYTTIVSPGYFIARREVPGAVMLGTIAALTVGAVVVLLSGG